MCLLICQNIHSSAAAAARPELRATRSAAGPADLSQLCIIRLRQTDRFCSGIKCHIGSAFCRVFGTPCRSHVSFVRLNFVQIFAKKGRKCALFVCLSSDCCASLTFSLLLRSGREKLQVVPVPAEVLQFLLVRTKWPPVPT